MKVLSSEDQRLVMDYVNDLVDQQPSTTRSPNPEQVEPEPADKRQKLDFVREFDDDVRDDTEKSEVADYVDSTVSLQLCINILKWWNDNSNR